MRKAIVTICILLLASPSVAGTVYGHVMKDGKSIPKGWKIIVTLQGAEKPYIATTDKNGNYRMILPKGAIELQLEGPKKEKVAPSLKLTSFKYPVKYNLSVSTDKKAKKLELKREK